MRNAAFYIASCNPLWFSCLLMLFAQEVVHGLDGVER